MRIAGSLYLKRIRGILRIEKFLVLFHFFLRKSKRFPKMELVSFVTDLFLKTHKTFRMWKRINMCRERKRTFCIKKRGKVRIF